MRMSYTEVKDLIRLCGEGSDQIFGQSGNDYLFGDSSLQKYRTYATT